MSDSDDEEVVYPSDDEEDAGVGAGGGGATTGLDVGDPSPPGPPTMVRQESYTVTDTDQVR